MKIDPHRESIDYSTACSMTGEATPGGWESHTYLPRKGVTNGEATGVAMVRRRRLQGIQDLRFVRRLVALVRTDPDAPFGTVITSTIRYLSDAKGDHSSIRRVSVYVGHPTINLNLNTLTLTLTKG